MALYHLKNLIVSVIYVKYATKKLDWNRLPKGLPSNFASNIMEIFNMPLEIPENRGFSERVEAKLFA